MIVFDIFAALLAAFGLVCLGWLAFGRMILPVGGEGQQVYAVIPARGDGGGLEQAVSGLLWLRGTGLLRGQVVILDKGLSPQGLAVARQLAERDGVDVLTMGAGDDGTARRRD